MVYRLSINKPDAQAYVTIFRRYAEEVRVSIAPGLTDQLLQRYQNEGRDLRASEPRDLIERAREICELRDIPFVLSPEVMTTAWAAYFGESSGATR
jgi:hypothetical protein